MTLPEFPERASSDAVVHDAAARQAVPRFTPLLVPKLRAAHAALNARVADLVGAIDRDPAANVRVIDECARQFGALREAETTWLYPLLAHAVSADAGARGQLMELRLIGLIMARRVLRCFDDLQQATRAEVLVRDAATRAASALSRYSQHSENAVYPLYEMIGPESRAAAVA